MKIAIDGPAGAGKSTLARALASRLGYIYIDTGAMYRALAWKALQAGLDLNDATALSTLAAGLDLTFDKQEGEQRLICQGEDITGIIRSPQISAVVSQVAAHPQVRNIMVRKQQQMASAGRVVMDGRDIGEQVLPDADFKFFVTADLQERVQRRLREMESRGYQVDSEAILHDMRNRDLMDSARSVGALKILPDSIVIDTSAYNADEVLAQILFLIGEA
ncbi:MAG TPA: (d)CMP kinase [Syntrophomonadaceae bacterium]|nr:(d)CMP kinase [Syntrophomonadaceae bacterium]